MNNELKDVAVITGAIICLIGLFVGAFVGVAWLGTGVRLGQTYKTVGYVQLYEHSSWITPHTWVVLETRGGVEAKITLLGYHDFDVGELYQINTICKRSGLWGTDNWYAVTEIHCLQGD